MDPMEINDAASLKAWLSGKPTEWAQAIALRAALRSLPYIGVSPDQWLKDFALLPFGAVLTSWIQLTESSIDIFIGSRANARFGGETFNFAGYKASQVAALAADVSYHSADAQTQSKHVFSDCIEAVGGAAEAFRLVSVQRGVLRESGDTIVETFWRNVAIDSNRLQRLQPSRRIRSKLEEKQLWLGDQPMAWSEYWTKCRQQLLTIDPNYSVWIDWYNRRVLGARAAFDIPGDKGRIEDKKILRRLAEATDEDFWGKGHEYVNATLKGWLDEARARAAPQTVIGTVGLTTSIETAFALPPAPTQNRNTISFRTNEDGKITIDASASVDQLHTDAEARDRHSEAASEAQAVLDRCRGNNAAARLTLRLENYLAAIGISVEDTKPSLLVQRGEKLRQELAAYAAPDTLLDPIADDILVDLRGWQSSHNMMVGLDPVLMAIDTAMLGPDRRPALIPPDEIKQVAHYAQEADLLAEGTEEIIIEAADLAPAIPDPNDRLTNASIEMVRNLIIETVSIVLNYPIKSAAAATVISGIVSPILVGGMATPISILSSIKAAEYLVAHRQWIEERMGDTPTWQTLFLKVADWLEKATPFKPK
jgi:hypothetical protein